MDYLQALDAICHLFIRKRARAQILSGPSTWATVARSLVLEPGTNQVELLRVEDRRMLVNLARPMLREWPDAFVDFARQTGLSQEHLSGTELMMPDWMRSAVYENLRKQNRLTVEAVTAEIVAMQTAGLQVTKQALRGRLGSDAKAIKLLLPSRLKANWLELRRFTRRLTSKRQWRRRRQTVALVRNQLHLILAVLSGQTLDAVASMTARDIHAFVDGVSEPTGSERVLAQALCERWSRLSARASSWADPSYPLRTSKNTDAVRFARQALVAAMTGLKLDLRRDVSVFWRTGRPHQV
ncbi:hypothetical protein [Variovorax sp. J31P207]|uniref:hypothetical protein n=1 Tax=Variovorax sp. J31P207 TaxID=3053510 RepID=UPI0025753AC1|nr:hypothetical protein [Variovorax sp. J31P207]MDM0065377.1 hypothetical protein [Variovorax sp. J31P207]